MKKKIYNKVMRKCVFEENNIKLAFLNLYIYSPFHVKIIIKIYISTIDYFYVIKFFYILKLLIII